MLIELSDMPSSMLIIFIREFISTLKKVKPMKFIKSTFIILLAFFSLNTQAQTADEILDGYYEAIGGRDAWSKVEGVKYTAKVNQGGMEIPVEMVQMKGGNSFMKISFQGLNIMQNVFDGETLWNTNFQTMKPEKATSEQIANHKLNNNDFPDPLLNYKENKYKLELIGSETFDGTEAFKLKLTKEPVMLDGKKVDDVEFYFFETESFALIGSESEITEGPMKGSISQTKLSDYQEVEGLMMPFSINDGVKDGPSQPIVIEKIELNPTFDTAILAFPEAATEAPAKAQPATGGDK